MSPWYQQNNRVLWVFSGFHTRFFKKDAIWLVKSFWKWSKVHLKIDSWIMIGQFMIEPCLTSQMLFNQSDRVIWYFSCGNQNNLIEPCVLRSRSRHLSLCFSPWKSETFVTGEFWKCTVWISHGVFPVKNKKMTPWHFSDKTVREICYRITATFPTIEL